MTIHHSMICAFPKMKCPPNVNDWLPSREQIHQLLSPLTVHEQSTLKLVDTILEGNTTKAHWQVFENSQIELGTPHPINFIRTIFNAIECARYINLSVALPTQTHSTDSPNLDSVLQAQGGQPYLGMQYVYPWLVPYRKFVESNKYREADNLLCENLWLTCENQVQKETNFSAILARYIQWKLCSQRQIIEVKGAANMVKSNLTTDIQISA